MGRKQTPEHIAKRIKSGPEHPNWIGDDVSVKGGRSRALRMYAGKRRCETCNAPKAERHHKDGDTSNNLPSNIKFLCRKCHMIEDGRLEKVRSSARLRLVKAVELAAIQKLDKTHCKRGHEYSHENTYINRRGARVCKECQRMHKRNFRKKDTSK